MPKVKSVYICQQCGYEMAKWAGRCPSCNEWNSMVEKAADAKRNILSKNLAISINDVVVTCEDRFLTGSKELDRVLGGGVVRGSLVLIGGDPGIGKSTLLLQICEFIGKTQTILYASGEESLKQIKFRADRLNISNPKLMLMAETNLDEITYSIDRVNPDMVILDSVQTVYRPEMESAPGSVSQVREVTAQLMRLAKEKNIAVFIVGHVTKEGALAGPRMLEHMVDCVLYFEGERHQTYRILRAVKNRFGSTNEIGLFEMVEKGLAEVDNPSVFFLSGRPENVSGAAVICTMEGTRPILAEVQALVCPTSFAVPRRMSVGIDYNRVTLLMAVLEKRVGLRLQNYDAYVNVIGGIKIDEPAADLGIIIALASNFKNIAVDAHTVVMGEVGLTGEVRVAGQIEKRLGEVSKLGFKTCIIPNENTKNLKYSGDLIIKGVKNVEEALRAL